MRMASSSTLLGIVLAVSIFSAGVITDRLTNVYVTNFPLDDQGNLRIKVVEKPSSVYKESVRVVLFSIEGKTYGAYGIGPSHNYQEVGVYSIYPFEFNPKGKSWNITEALIFTVVSTPTDALDYYFANVTINGRTEAFTPKAWFPFNSMNAVSFNVTSFGKTFTEGINTLQIAPFTSYPAPIYYLETHEISIFIEYEYLA